jgi:hypothetical protein
MKRSCLFAGIGLAAAAGCSREHYRARADKDVEAVISQKNIFPDWKVENWHAYPDPRARFADPSNPDAPPYPPDDYAAYVSSPNPQRPGRGGAGRYEGDGYLKCLAEWDARNRAEDEAAEADGRGEAGLDRTAAGTDQPDARPTREPKPPTDAKAPPDGGPKDRGTVPEADPQDKPADRAAAAAAAGGAAYADIYASQAKPFRIRLDQAVELAIFNSREFQDRREDLYLAALPVTLERFAFAAQAFAAERIIRQSILQNYTPGGPSENWQIGTDLGVSRTFATGGTLLVRLANQIVIDLSGPNPQTSLSNLSLTFAQPLLQGGGYAVTLENLTQAERTLVYAIRSYSRFRNQFYAAVAGQGSSVQTGGQGGGGGTGGGAGYTNNPYGLQGLSANLGRGVGANLTSNAIGYFNTVLQAATLANQRRNVTTLEQFLRLFRNLNEGGAVTELQVGRVEQNLINGRITVLTSSRSYLDGIDNFKLQLGLPTTVPLELDSSPVRPVRQQLARFEELFDQFRQLEEAAGRADPNEPAGALRERWRRLLTDSSLARGTRFAQQWVSAEAALRPLTTADLDRRAADLLTARRRLLDARADRQLKGVAETPAQEAEIAAADAELDRIRFELALRRYEARPWAGAAPARQAAEQALGVRAVLEAGLLVAAQPRNERLARIRSAWPGLRPVLVDGADVVTAPLDEAYERAGQTALLRRLDLQNARAQVVDSWRQIAVQANSLLGIFDVRYDLETQSPRDQANGLEFGANRTRHTVTLRVEPPFVRRAERNAYRAALISYQRSRRNLMAFEDNILVDARSDLRVLRQLAESYKLQQRAVEVAYAQVDNARSTLVAPPDPAARDTAAAQASLTEQLLSAQQALVQAQNTLYSTWVAYTASRIEFLLDMELLTLDSRGLWTDEQPPSPPPAGPAPPQPPPPPPGPQAAGRPR